MGKLRTIGLGVVFIIILAGCESPLNVPVESSPGPRGTVYISLIGDDAGSRTLYPVVQFDKYVLHFNSATDQVPSDKTITENTYLLDLPVGTWTISATGYVGDTALVTGEKTFEVVADTFQEISITVTKPLSGRGQLAYTLTYSDDLRDLSITGSLTLSPMNDSGSISGSSTVRSLSCSAQGDSGSISFTSGFYLLRIAITAGTGTDKRIITRTEIVHIYPNTPTEVVASFTALDFTSLVLGGTIQILENESVNYVYAYSDAQYANLIESAPVTAGTWYMPVQSYQEASRIYFKASLTSASTLFLDAGSIPTPLDSKTDIVLGENLYKLAGPTWSEDTMAEETIQYYYFYAKPGDQYTIKWDDYQDGSGTSGDITVSAYQGDRQYFFTEVDSGYTSPQTVQIIRGGYVILKIESGSRDGTYRLCAMSDAKSISWVTFQGISNARISINESNKSIIGEMPYGTDIAHLEPRFTYTGADYSPHGVQDFTNPVDYTVIAEDGTEAVYTVTLSVRGQANIKLPSFIDEIIQGFPGTPISLSKDISGTIHTTSVITIADTGYDEYQWYVDNRVKPGDSGSSGRSLTLDALDYTVGTHTVSIVVYKNGVPYSQEQTFTVTILKGQAGISIAGPPQLAEESIQGFFGSPISLSKDVSGTVHTTSVITIADTGYDEYQWYVDNRVKPGDSGSSGRSLTLDALDYTSGTHTVSIVVYKNGIPYSQEQTFTVTILKGQVGISIAGPPQMTEEIIQGFFGTPISLFKNASDTWHTTSIITIEEDTGYEEYQWYVDNRVKPGDSGSGGRSLILDALDYTPGTHTVSIVVYKNGVPYSQEQTFTVTILSSEKAITGFEFTNPAVSGVIDESAKTIRVAVPYGTDITSLTPVLTHTGVAYSPQGAQNFTGSQEYTVTAEDGSIQVYTVQVGIKGQGGISIAGPPQMTEEIIQGFFKSITLSKSASGSYNTSIITIADTGYEEYQWYVDNKVKLGDSGSGGRSLTLDARDYTPGTHTVSIVVYKNGIPYSQEQTFRVVFRQD